MAWRSSTTTGIGDLDVLIVTGSTFDRLQAGGDRMVTLFRNDGGRFTDVTTASGLARRGWGTGVCVADYDNDGFAGHLRDRVHR